MSKIKELVEWLESRVGHAYVMGGTGQPCTPSYRKVRAIQYPSSEKKIIDNCPVLSGKQSKCDGCKYDGKRAYDCAQLTRWAFDSIGIKLVSGATSQWNKTEWAEKGEISTMPPDKICMVFRQDNKKTMGHVGVYMGDGSVIHARGHAYGVVRTGLFDTNWTHWGCPAGLYDIQVQDKTPTEKERLIAVIKELESIVNGIYSA